MKRIRPFLIGVIALVAVLLAVAAIAFNSSFQTWVLRRFIASRPGLNLTVGRVSAGLATVELTNVEFHHHGVVIQAPRIHADLSTVGALLHGRYTISSLVATGWTIDCTEGNAAATTARFAAGPDHTTGVAEAGPAATTPAPTKFHGVFPAVDLPFGISVDGLLLTGSFRCGDMAAEVKVDGGGLGAGRDGKFAFNARTSLRDEQVQTVTAHGDVTVSMNSPRTFGRIAGVLEVTAEGAKLAAPVMLHIAGEATRAGHDEHYRLQATQAARELASVNGEFTEGGNRLTGKWKIDLRDTDVAAFTLGHPIPVFVVTGAGSLDTDPGFTGLHAVGTLEASVDQLARANASLAGIGAITFKADVDLAHRDNVFTVAKLEAVFATSGQAASAGAGAVASKPVGTLRALQAFEFNPSSGDVEPTDPAKDLVSVQLDDVPLTWAKPFLNGFEVVGSDVRGELTARARAGGLTFRTQRPLAVSHLMVSRAAKVLVRDVDVSVGVSGDYTPRGWQAELSGLTARSGATTILLLDAKAGRLPGADQPLKTTGLISADLSALARQPALAPYLAIAHGDATVEFAASLGATKQIQANVAIKNLAAIGAAAEPMPAVTATLRADVAENGSITVNAPISLERGGRKSDVALVGSFEPSGAAVKFDAQVTSGNLVIDDAKVLGAVLAPKAPESANGAAKTPVMSPWSGWNGSVAVECKRLVYTGKFQMSNVTGKVRISAGTVEFNNVHAGVGESGQARFSGALTFDPTTGPAYRLGADVAVTDFDPGPFFFVVNPGRLPTVEGHFAITTRLTSRAPTIAALAHAAVGEFEITSKSGTFRGLPVNVGNLVENSSKLSAWLAAAGDAIASPFIGRKDQDEITSRSQAANELAKILSSIVYDQLAIVVSRDARATSTIKEFTLISPELRLSGGGTARREAGGSVLNEDIDLELRVRARGRPAELMKYLGILDPKTDDLGYAACTIPVSVNGALTRLDTTLSNRLVALAVSPKTGITEKAVDWINRLRGKSTN